ncbi:uncharacterized protein LOC111716756 isoform X2 [Eurytemora carolleeae]|uniref:uncharacterized protein LOC111716756 isoform X2 n=1 Tax=Eurytemora carolleeae TaxID=1294199 RepID=UPI000C783A38|nr:uncharacterized protein LOC111716756 isoform X2 [Eurytemora carolleeae]|eukprot:XP_023348004.1 uncharacterized protein LOC111716756 isoform X2 [Eurytemora affinis]
MLALEHMNIGYILAEIFLYLSPGDLHVSRQVCRAWNSCIVEDIWNRKKNRRIFENSLQRRWLKGECSRNIYPVSRREHDCGVRLTNQYFLLHSQLFKLKFDPIFALYSVKDGGLINETRLELKDGHRLHGVEVTNYFITASFSDAASHGDNHETIQVLGIPSLQIISNIPAAESPQMFTVADSYILTLSPFKTRLELSELTLFNPILKSQSKFKIRLSFYDVLNLSFDGRYALVRTIDEIDQTNVYDVIRSRTVTKGLKTGMFQLNEVFVYPLLCTIQDHCYLKIYNLEERSSLSRFIHEPADLCSSASQPRTEIGLGNKLLISRDSVYLTRYLKHSSDHSQCSAFLDIFNLDQIKVGNLVPSVLSLQLSGPLFDEISISQTGIVLLNNKLETVEIFRFWT